MDVYQNNLILFCTIQKKQQYQTKILPNSFLLEKFSIRWSKIKTKVIALANHNRRWQCNEPIRTRSKYMYTCKRRKTRASKSRLVLVLLLIGWESGARFFNQSLSVAMQKQLGNYFRHSIETRSKWSHCKISSADSKIESWLVQYDKYLLSTSTEITAQ